MRLQQPANPQFDYESLSYFISLWWSIEAAAPWVGREYPTFAPIHSSAVSSRQWDTSLDLLDDELEKNTALLLGECMEKLEAVERCLIMYAHCNVLARWVQDMEPKRAQERYEAALLKLAVLSRRSGIDV